MIRQKMKYLLATLLVLIGGNAVAAKFNLEASAQIEELKKERCMLMIPPSGNLRCVRIIYTTNEFYWSDYVESNPANKSEVNFSSSISSNNGSNIFLAGYNAIGVMDNDIKCEFNKDKLTCTTSWDSIYKSKIKNRNVNIEALFYVDTNPPKVPLVFYFTGSGDVPIRRDEPVLRDIWLDIRVENDIECDHTISTCSITPKTMTLKSDQVFIDDSFGGNKSKISDRLHYYF